MTPYRQQRSLSGPIEIRLGNELMRLFESYAAELGKRRAHEIFKGATATIGETLRGPKGPIRNPRDYSTEREAKKKRRQRDPSKKAKRTLELLNRPLSDFRDATGDGKIAL